MHSYISTAYLLCLCFHELLSFKLSLRFEIQNFIWWVSSPVGKSQGETAEALEQNKISIMKLKSTLRKKKTLFLVGF